MATKPISGDSTALIQMPVGHTVDGAAAEESLLLACPNEVLIEILSNLNERDLARASLACRRLFNLSNDNFLWKNLFIKIFPVRASKVVPTPQIIWKPLHQMAFRIESNLVKGICQERTLPAHAARVTSIVHHAPYLITADCEGTMKIRAANPEHSYDEVQTIVGCTDGMIQFHPETGRIAFPTEDGSIQLMHKPSAPEPFALLQTLAGDGSKIVQFALNKDHLFFVTGNNHFYIWKKEPDGNYVHADTTPNILKFTNCADSVALLKTDSSIDIWKINEDKTLGYSYSPAETTPSLDHACEIRSTDDHLFISNFHGRLKIFAKEDNGQLKEIQIRSIITRFLDSITQLYVHEDYLVTGSLKGQVRIFRKQESKDYAEIPCAAVHTDRINQIVMKEDFLCIASTDSKTSILRKNSSGTFDLLTYLRNPEQAATTVAIEEDRFISGYADGQMRIWDFT
ncbi:MAG: F-box/WD repeat-containing protein [Verrucomicrobia bacterium]|nr:F-box/WD repeat-containing protein [Verrucomicrobiota bacterium]